MRARGGNMRTPSKTPGKTTVRQTPSVGVLPTCNDNTRTSRRIEFEGGKKIFETNVPGPLHARIRVSEPGHRSHRPAEPSEANFFFDRLCSMKSKDGLVMKLHMDNARNVKVIKVQPDGTVTDVTPIEHGAYNEWLSKQK